MILLYAFAAVVFINCLYLLLFSKFSFYPIPSTQPYQDHSVSVIICAKNEAENLRNNIPIWLEQEYPNFEIIIINDASTDETLEVIENFVEQDARVKLVNVENNEAFWGNKKYALTLGIKKALNKRMLFTDADCRPASSKWLLEMSSHFTEDKQLILGYGAYIRKGGLLNKLIRFETLMTAVQYFSYAIVGLPYMGVGRNLGYTSNLFYSANGFMSHMKIASGDDDLFINEVATKKNTSICISPDTFTYSQPKQSFISWFIQKKRHITTSKRYKLKHRFLLGLFFVSNLLFWTLAIASVLLLDWKIPAILIGIRFLAQWIILGKSAQKLKEKDLILIFPLLDLFLVFLQLSIFISNTIKKPAVWK